jgi:hypothetical protein
MSTQYPIHPATLTPPWESPNCFTVSLDEGSCKFQLVVNTCDQTFESDRMTEDQVIEMAARLLGPMFYFDPGGKVMEKFLAALTKGGYTP